MIKGKLCSMYTYTWSQGVIVMSLTPKVGCVGLSQVSRDIEMFIKGEKYSRAKDIHDQYGEIRQSKIKHYLPQREFSQIWTHTIASRSRRSALRHHQLSTLICLRVQRLYAAKCSTQRRSPVKKLLQQIPKTSINWGIALYSEGLVNMWRIYTPDSTQLCSRLATWCWGQCLHDLRAPKIGRLKVINKRSLSSQKK